MSLTPRRRRPAHLRAAGGAAAGVVAAVLAAGGLTACTQAIAGIPGRAPTVDRSGDVSSPTDTASDEPTSDSSESDTSDPSASDEPTGLPTDIPTDDSTEDPASPQALCDRLQFAVEVGQGADAATVRSYVSTMILIWGLANGDEDPYATADPVTTQTCPDIRTQVLTIAQLPDLASTRDS